MSSLKRHEGYLLLDNSAGPGVPDSLLPDHMKGLGRGKVEQGTVTCSHCHNVVILNPLRTRPRNYCRRCDHYICDSVACNTQCRPLKAFIESKQEEIALAQQSLLDPTARHILRS